MGPYKNASGTPEYEYTCDLCGATKHLCDGGAAAGSQHCSRQGRLICNRGGEITGYTLGCGKTEQTIESATIVFN